MPGNVGRAAAAAARVSRMRAAGNEIALKTEDTPRACAKPICLDDNVGQNSTSADNSSKSSGVNLISRCVLVQGGRIGKKGSQC